MMPRPTSQLMRTAPLALVACLLATACGAIATTPSWTGGGMASTGPIRVANREAAEALDRTELATQPDEIRARHILVMHDSSKAKPEEVQRTREKALARTQECLKKLRGGGDFAKLVAEYSDEPGAAERDGDLGQFRRDVMIKAFSDAAFALEVREISEVIETPYGFHIIQRLQ